MTYFQNPFTAEFRGTWVLEDRQFSPTFICPQNYGRGDDLVCAWGEPSGTAASPRTYDLSGNDADGDAHATLHIRYAMDGKFVDWHQLSIDITDDTNVDFTAVPAAMLSSQIVAILNAHSTFSTFFTASLGVFSDTGIRAGDRILIRQKLATTRMKFYILNTQAEEVLLFNKRAGVAELPTYFARHTIFNRATDGSVAFDDGVNMLVELDPNAAGGSSVVDDNVIENAIDKNGISLGFDPSTVQEDWELLKGRSTTFSFRIFSNAALATSTTEIVYPAGAQAGDLAKKIIRHYNGSSVLLREWILPYTLTSGDMISPP